MKNTCRRNGYISLIALVVMLLMILGTLTACGNPNQVSGRYDLEVLEATPNFYVNDFAGVFSEDQIEGLMQQAVTLDKDYSGIQVVVTTVESLDKTVLGYEYVVEDANGNRVEDSSSSKQNHEPKFTIEEVAYSMYSQYGIGQDDMGILILFSTGDREVRIETGRAMQVYITDSLSGRILDKYGMDYFAQNKFDEGLISVQTAVISEIMSQVSPDWAENSQTSKNETEAVVAPNVNSQENSGEVQNVADDAKAEKDTGNGLLFGIFGSIAAMFAAIGAFIRQRFKGKAEKEAFEKARQEEISAVKADFQSKLDQKDRVHESEVSKMKRDYQRLIQVRDTDIQELNNELSQERRKFGTLKTEYEELEDKYRRAQRLHPEYNFEEEVQEMIESEYKASAKEIDEKLMQVLSISASKDNYDVFNRALSLIDGSQSEVRKYITSDRAAIENLYEEAVRLKKEHERAVQEEKDRKAANDAYEKIKDACNKNPIGNYKNFAALSTAFALFSGLTAAQKQFFPDCKLISELEGVHRAAESDFNNYEAARKAESNVEDIIGGMYSADEDDRDKLERAMRFYRNLSESQKAYFSADLLSKLRKLIDEAEDDYNRQERKRRQEAEERRRRAAAASRSSSSFSSSHRSSSSFSGRGGRPSGGGASRRF